MSTEEKVSLKPTYFSLLILVLLTVLALSVRIWNQNAVDLPSGDSVWTIGLTVQATAKEKGAKILIPPPWDTRYARMYAQSITHFGLKQKKGKSQKKTRDITLVAPSAGHYAINAQFGVQLAAIARKEPGKFDLSEENRSRWLSGEGYKIQINTEKTIGIVEQFISSTNSTEQLIEQLYDYISNNTRIKKHTNNNSETVISKRIGTDLGVNRTLVALLRTAHIPARVVTGIDLHAGAKRPLVYWTEVYNEQHWISLDPARGYLKALPAHYIPLRRGSSDLFVLEEMKVDSVTWSIEPANVSPSLLSEEERHLSEILNLNRISPAGRENLGVLLLMPLGVLITEILRQIIGIRTYGTFTPTLLALAVMHVDRTTALIIFSIVTIIGISIRSLLPVLALKRTPLLSIVFTLVVLSMTFIVSGFKYIDPGMDDVVVLLPVVILTMLIDRIFAIVDQRQLRIAMLRLFWTIIAAIFSLLILMQSDVGQILVSYPELHAITLAAIILIGRGSRLNLRGIKLLSWMFEPEPGKTKKLKDRKTDSPG